MVPFIQPAQFCSENLVIALRFVKIIVSMIY